MRGKKGTKTPSLDDAKLATLEEQGRLLVDSEIFKAVRYEPFKDSVSIHAGANGAINIYWNMLDDLISELTALQEVYDEAYYTRRTG